MKYRELGQSELNVSTIAMGCWAIAGDAMWGPQDEQDAIEAIQTALDLGVNLFDTAEGYGIGESERLLARGLGARREEEPLETNGSRLQEAYDVRILPSDDPDRHALGVEFVPKPTDEGDEPFFMRVIIQLAKGDLLPSTILIVNDEESSTSFQISDYQLNVDLPETASHIVVPEGTTIVDNGTYIGEAPVDGAIFPATTSASTKPLVVIVLMTRPPPSSTLFPHAALFRSTRWARRSRSG